MELCIAMLDLHPSPLVVTQQGLTARLVWCWRGDEVKGRGEGRTFLCRLQMGLRWS